MLIFAYTFPVSNHEWDLIFTAKCLVIAESSMSNYKSLCPSPRQADYKRAIARFPLGRAEHVGSKVPGFSIWSVHFDIYLTLYVSHRALEATSTESQVNTKKSVVLFKAN